MKNIEIKKWSQKIILIAECDDFSQDVIKLLSKNAQVHQKKTGDVNLIKDFREYDVFWFRLGFIINKDVILDSKRRVSTIVCPVTGLDHIDLHTCKKVGIKVISLKGEIDFLKDIAYLRIFYYENDNS